MLRVLCMKPFLRWGPSTDLGELYEIIGAPRAPHIKDLSLNSVRALAIPMYSNCDSQRVVEN